VKILAFCPSGHVFETRALRMFNTSNLSLKGNRETCPYCGDMAEIMDGEYEVIDGAMRLLSAPEVTHGRLRSLRSLVEDLWDQDASSEDVGVALDREVPTLGRLLPSDRKALLAWLTILLMVIDLLLQRYDHVHEPPEVTPDQIDQLIDEIIERQGDLPEMQPEPQPRPNRQQRRQQQLRANRRDGPERPRGQR
jgi:hypothetical protein